MAAADAYLVSLVTLNGYFKWLAATNPNLGDTLARLNETLGTTYSYGTSANQVNQFYMVEASASSTQTYTFSNSSLTDVAGDVLNLATIREIIIANTSSGSIIIGGNIITGTSSSVFTGTSGSLGGPAGMVFRWSNPVTGMGITIAVRDTISVNPGGVSRTWTLFVLGVAA